MSSDRCCAVPLCAIFCLSRSRAANLAVAPGNCRPFGSTTRVRRCRQLPLGEQRGEGQTEGDHEWSAPR
jgi:hypothetical protein